MYNASLWISEDYQAISYENHNVPTTSDMSPTATTTTSPPTRLQIQQIAAVSPVTGRPLLTSPFSSGLNLGTGASEALPNADNSSELPPAKRIRLGPPTSHQKLVDCLQRQVFPHIDAQIATLPKERVNTLAIGKQVVALLTGQEFSREYNSRGDGTISLKFEAKLADLAALHVQSLARRLVKTVLP
jgi:hypothetical protein